MIEAILREAAKEGVIKTLKEVSEVAVKDIPLETMDIVENGSLEALEVRNQLLEPSFKGVEDMKIGVQEQKIYDDAGLVNQMVNGREVLIQPNVDYNAPLGIPGNESETNLDRMKAGYSPMDENGNPYQLHHIGQENDSPLAELTNEQHQYNGNYSVLHTKEGPSEIDRKEFNEQRSEHWKERASQIEYSNN